MEMPKEQKNFQNTKQPLLTNSRKLKICLRSYDLEILQDRAFGRETESE